MSMLNLDLDLFNKIPTDTASKPTEQPKGDVTWLKIANMHNSAFAVDVAKRKLVAVVAHDRAVCDAVNLLANAKSVIKTYGASESIMAYFNQGNQLADCIGMSIPEITEANASAVGIACCESIDSTVVGAYDKVKEFFDALISTANNFFSKLKIQTASQSETIDTIVDNIIDSSESISADEFAKLEVFGYTQPVFMNRVVALQFINDHLATCEANNESMLQFGPALKSLGYKIVEKSSEGIMDGETDQIESELQIVPDTAEEAPAEGGEQPTPAEGGEGEAAAPAPAPAAESLAPAQHTMAAFLWNPSTVRSAAVAIKAILVGSEKLSNVSTSLGNIQGTVVSAIETITSDDNANKVDAEATITSGRRYAAFVGDILAIYSSASNELVDQVVCMSAKLVASKPTASEAAPAEGAPAPANGEPKEGDQPAKPEGEGDAPATPAEGEPAKNGVENPENVPQTKPVDPNAPVCPNGEPQPGKAPHVQPTETPESQQPTHKAEPLMEDVEATRLW